VDANGIVDDFHIMSGAEITYLILRLLVYEELYHVKKDIFEVPDAAGMFLNFATHAAESRNFWHVRLDWIPQLVLVSLLRNNNNSNSLFK